MYTSDPRAQLQSLRSEEHGLELRVQRLAQEASSMKRTLDQLDVQIRDAQIQRAQAEAAYKRIQSEGQRATAERMRTTNEIRKLEASGTVR